MADPDRHELIGSMHDPSGLQRTVDNRKMTHMVYKFLNRAPTVEQQTFPKVLATWGGTHQTDVDILSTDDNTTEWKRKGHTEKRKAPKGAKSPRKLRLLTLQRTASIMNAVFDAFRILADPFPGEFMDGAQTVAFINNEATDTQAFVLRNLTLKQVLLILHAPATCM